MKFIGREWVMKLTNRMGLPKTIVNAIERDSYTMGNARISVTGLLKPPRIGLLYKKHYHEIEKDVTDHVWSLFGRAVHVILEQGGDEEHIPEERLYAEVRGWRISGQLDVQKIGGNKVKIIDYKTCRSFAVMAEKPEWAEQLNVYAWLVEQAKGYDVAELAICAFVRDWNRHRASEPDYPSQPAVMINIPMWSREEVASFVEHRVRVHQEAQALWDMSGDAPHCTDTERWMRRTKYVLMKRGNKRPTRLFDTRVEAQQWAEQHEGSYYIEERKSEPLRCTGDFCNVSKWCSQYKEWLDGSN